MLLRSIEVYGFKSFADKIHIDLNYGVTAIVGPNGSGKSNISDAVRWALGEQSNKLLRSTKMEDVIFSGSANRRPLGIAEVSLIFDNSDGHLALDFNEIIITRRVFRSGESEYYINKTLCRLKDINELLTDTGIGKDTMTVIGQNKVDEVLSSKPEDRRLLFEEAAGISKYKNRKREALRKLETTEQNLIRLRDIILEIENQLEPLEESANKTRIYNELNSELKACQITILVDKLNKAEKMVVSSQIELKTLNENTLSLKTELSLKEAEKEQLHLNIIDLEKEILALNQSISNADTELEKISGKNAVLEERINQSLSSKEKLIAEISKTVLEEENLKKEIAELSNLSQNTKNQITDLNTSLESKNSNYNSLLLHIENLEKQVSEGREKTFDYLKQMVDERNALRTLHRDLENLKLKETNLAKELDQYLVKIELNNSKKEELTTSLEHLKESFQNIETNLQHVLKSKDESLTKLNSLKSEEEKNNKNSAQVLSHLNALKGMQQDFEGFNKAIKNVLKSPLNKSNSYKAVAELINVPSQYVTAVETALGSTIQNIVTEHENAATEAINFLKKNKSGRATFLPLNTLKILSPNKNEESLAKSKEALGFLCDFVKTDKKYEPIIKFLLGRTILAENIEKALSLAKKSSFSIRVVTLSGEIIRPGGSITGGATVHQDNGFLSRKNRISELEANLVKLQEEAKSIYKNIAEINAKLDAATLEINKINVEKQEIEIKQAELKIVIEQNAEEANSLNFALNTIKNEISLVKNEQTDIAEKIIEKEKLLISLQGEDEAQKDAIVKAEEELKTTKSNLDISNTELTDLKVKLSALNQEANAQNENLIKYEKSQETLSLEKSSLIKEEALLDQ
ncbi:chromosome segregation protein SMC, partial [Selenomonadales bacterium OttesenSCG-928-I06]|nr:chromosome segregation protein SMC [Selenomonadales bacterium OttesenSCG-928-I06]